MSILETSCLPPSCYLHGEVSVIVDFCRRGEDAAPTRVMVFAPTSEAAQACASPIRNVLWGAHKVAVLLPEGEEPIKVPERPLQPSLLCLSAFPFMLLRPKAIPAFSPSPLCLSASYVPFSIPLCPCHPAACASQYPPLHLSACSLYLFSISFHRLGRGPNR